MVESEVEVDKLAVVVLAGEVRLPPPPLSSFLEVSLLNFVPTTKKSRAMTTSCDSMLASMTRVWNPEASPEAKYRSCLDFVAVKCL